MARIQYQSSAQSRGFRAQQLSTAGIDRMREESDRIVRGMERRHAAENRQREENLQAMKENAEYETRIMRENQAIEMQNLQNKGGQQLANIQSSIQQSQLNKQAQDQIMSSLASFSKLAKAVIDKQEAEKQKEEAAQEAAAEVQTLDPEKVKAYARGENVRAKASIQLNTEVAANGVLNNEQPLDTYKGYIANHGLSGRAGKNVDNSVAVKGWHITVNDYLQGSEKNFTTPEGKAFSGVEALRDPYLLEIVAQQAAKDVFKYMGFTDPLYLASAKEDIKKATAVLRGQSETKGINQALAVLEERALNLESSGESDDILLAFVDRKSAKGAPAALDGLDKLIANPNMDPEKIRVNDYKGTGKTYDQEWPRRWEAALRTRQENIVKLKNAEDNLKKAEDREWVNNNIDEIQQAYNQNPQQAQALVLQRYHDKAMTVPEVIKSIEREALKNNKDLMESTVAQRAKYGILDLSFVNSIQDPELQKTAREAFETQQEQRYGPEALGIKKGFKATARSLTKINPNEEQGNAQTFLVQSRLESEYLKELKLTNDPLKALENVNKMVDAGRANDKSSPFYIDPSLGENNRPVFPNIESSDREVAEMNTYINKQLIKNGASVVDKPFALATANQMDAAYTSSLAGTIQYPPGILQAADTLGLKPSEIYNAHRMANNAATGVNKPLLTPSPATMLVDEAPSAMRKLFLSEEPAQIARAGAITTGKPLPVRASMGGGNPSPAEAYQYMRSLGVSDTHAKGILANIKGESNFQTDVMGDNGMSGGLFQMYNDRYRAMEQAVPDWRTNWRGQIEHALQDDTAPQYLSMEFNSPEEAADWFLENYERPAMEHRPGRRELNRTFIPSLGF